MQIHPKKRLCMEMNSDSNQTAMPLRGLLSHRLINCTVTGGFPGKMANSPQKYWAGKRIRPSH
jgi:hypothetical protein